jgi:hypothetical protein
MLNLKIKHQTIHDEEVVRNFSLILHFTAYGNGNVLGWSVPAALGDASVTFSATIIASSQ